MTRREEAVAAMADLDRVIDRLEWSWDHLERFRARIAEAVQFHTKPTAKVETEAGAYVDFVVDRAAPVPHDASFILGDCIHSLRASLDNVVFLLSPTDRAAFPICRTEKAWKRDKDRIKNLPAAARKIVRHLQPFEEHPDDPEADPLWVLHRLWNDDRHGAPELIVGITERVSRGPNPPGRLHAVQVRGGPLDVGSVVQRVWLRPGVEPRMDAAFDIEVAFDAMGPARGQGAYSCLAELHERVTDAIERFRPFFG